MAEDRPKYIYIGRGSKLEGGLIMPEDTIDFSSNKSVKLMVVMGTNIRELGIARALQHAPGVRSASIGLKYNGGQFPEVTIHDGTINTDEVYLYAAPGEMFRKMENAGNDWTFMSTNPVAPFSYEVLPVRDYMYMVRYRGM